LEKKKLEFEKAAKKKTKWPKKLIIDPVVKNNLPAVLRPLAIYRRKRFEKVLRMLKDNFLTFTKKQQSDKLKRLPLRDPQKRLIYDLESGKRWKKLKHAYAYDKKFLIERKNIKKYIKLQHSLHKGNKKLIKRKRIKFISLRHNKYNEISLKRQRVLKLLLKDRKIHKKLLKKKLARQYVPFGPRNARVKYIMNTIATLKKKRKTWKI